MNAVVNPHPGQLNPNNDFQIQGIQKSILVKAFRLAENKK
jgi:hypothetical protein